MSILIGMKNYKFLQWTVEEIKIVILSVLLYVSSYLLDFRIFGDFLFLFPGEQYFLPDLVFFFDFKFLLFFAIY